MSQFRRIDSISDSTISYYKGIENSLGYSLLMCEKEKDIYNWYVVEDGENIFIGVTTVFDNNLKTSKW